MTGNHIIIKLLQKINRFMYENMQILYIKMNCLKIIIDYFYKIIKNLLESIT
jgi:hypothetical protein